MATTRAAVFLLTLFLVLGSPAVSQRSDDVPACLQGLAPLEQADPARESRLRADRIETLRRLYPPLDHPQWQSRLERIGARLVAATESPRAVWRFEVLHGAPPNAATAGEGYLCVTDALMELGLSDSELAGIMAHEIAHGVLRHAFDREDLRHAMEHVRSQRSGASPDEVVLMEGRLERLSYRMDHLDCLDRWEEEQADRFGMACAARAGFHPAGIVGALERITGLRAEELARKPLEEPRCGLSPKASRACLERRIQLMLRELGRATTADL